MTATVVGTAYTGSGATTIGAKTVVNVTIPAAATGAIIGIGYYVNTAGTKTVSAVTLDAKVALKETAFEAGSGGNDISVWSVSGFATGASKTLGWTNDQAMSDGVSLYIVFVQDCDTTDVVTSAASAGNSASGGTATTAALTIPDTRLVISMIAADNTAVPTYGTGQAQITGTAPTASEIGYATQETRSGNDTQSVTGDFASIGAVVISNLAASVAQSTLALLGVGA